MFLYFDWIEIKINWQPLQRVGMAFLYFKKSTTQSEGTAKLMVVGMNDTTSWHNSVVSQKLLLLDQID